MFFVCPSAHPGSSSIRCKALNPFCRQSMKTSDILMSPISGQEYPCATSTHQLIATIPNGPQRNKQRSRPPPRSAEGPASELRGPRESAARPRRTSQWPAAPRSVTAVTMVTMASALSTVVWIHSYITINIYIYYIYNWIQLESPTYSTTCISGKHKVSLHHHNLLAMKAPKTSAFLISVQHALKSSVEDLLNNESILLYAKHIQAS